MHVIYDEVRKLLKIGIGRPMGEEGKPLQLGFSPVDLLHSSFSLSSSGRIFTLQQGIFSSISQFSISITSYQNFLH